MQRRREGHGEPRWEEPLVQPLPGAVPGSTNAPAPRTSPFSFAELGQWS